MFENWYWKEIAYTDIKNGDYNLVTNNLKNHNISFPQESNIMDENRISYRDSFK